MKTKRKSKKAMSSTKETNQQETTPQATVAPTSQPAYFGPMPPDMMLHEAEVEADKWFLREYVPVIRTLREKHFSYREIAKWLSERGVDADHNEVYRAYQRAMDPLEAAEEEQRERDEAEADAEH